MNEIRRNVSEVNAIYLMEVEVKALEEITIYNFSRKIIVMRLLWLPFLKH